MDKKSLLHAPDSDILLSKIGQLRVKLNRTLLGRKVSPQRHPQATFITRRGIRQILSSPNRLFIGAKQLGNVSSLRKRFTAIKLTEVVLGRPRGIHAKNRFLDRTRFIDRLDAARLPARKDGGKIAIMHLKIDDPATTDGHFNSKQLDLARTAFCVRLLGAVRKTDAIARFDNHEFAMIFEDLPGLGAAKRIANRILAETRSTDVHREPCFTPAASIGIAFDPFHECKRDQLLLLAETMLRSATATGMNTCRSGIAFG